MPGYLRFYLVVLLVAVTSPDEIFAQPAAAPKPQVAVERVFAATGVVQKISPAENSVTIKHEAISGFMPAMTMPFNVKEKDGLKGLTVGDEITFHLHVTATESWVNQFTVFGKTNVAEAAPVKPISMPAPFFKS